MECVVPTALSLHGGVAARCPRCIAQAESISARNVGDAGRVARLHHRFQNLRTPAPVLVPAPGRITRSTTAPATATARSALAASGLAEVGVSHRVAASTLRSRRTCNVGTAGVLAGMANTLVESEASWAATGVAARTISPPVNRSIRIVGSVSDPSGLPGTQRGANAAQRVRLRLQLTKPEAFVRQGAPEPPELCPVTEN
jgi:hypothetical protein